MQIISDIVDFCNQAEKSIDLNRVYELSVETLCKELIELGIFSDINSIKLYLATRPIRDIRAEEEIYPITYQKGYDQELEYDDYANGPRYNLTDSMCK